MEMELIQMKSASNRVEHSLGVRLASITVTLEMSQAGAEVLLDSGFLQYGVESGVELLARQVFEAMMEKSSGNHATLQQSKRKV